MAIWSKPTKRQQDIEKGPESPPHGRRQLEFDETESDTPWWKKFYDRVWKRLAEASTGSPTDGMGTASVGSAQGLVQGLAHLGPTIELEEDGNWKLDVVIVDREEGVPREDWTASNGRRKSGSRVMGSDSRDHNMHSGSNGSDRDSDEGLEGNWDREPVTFVKCVYRAIKHFFFLKMDDPAEEEEFQKMQYYSNKKLLFVACLFLYFNWALYLALNESTTLYERITYIGLLGALTIPLIPFIFFRLPQRLPIFFQIWLSCATWLTALCEVIQTKECHFYEVGGQGHTCQNKDFVAMLYYGTALPTLVLFSHGGRIYHAFFQICFFGLLVGLVIPDRSAFARNVVSFVLYSIFIQGFHFSLESAARRLFNLNNQLKTVYCAQQKAQMAESVANQTKKRFASYIFHEVRVPLNTAMLAYQNLQAEGVLKSMAVSSEQALEAHAMGQSLTMMQHVLNDVLDLERMDAGRFENNPEPFNFHNTMNVMLGSVRMATDTKQLGLVVDLDPVIDALRPNQGHGLCVIGDPVRLQQIVTNLASNAVKFSKTGSIKISTRLVSHYVPGNTPVSSARPSISGEDTYVEKMSIADGKSTPPPLVHGRPSQTGPGLLLKPPKLHFEEGISKKKECFTFRVEVTDTGPGIRPSDLINSKLFRPFSQTRVGKASGEGSGLGLAIVRQIVSLSNGRLGVISQPDQGATFWFELTYRLASPEESVGCSTKAIVPTVADIPIELAHLTRSLLPPGILDTPTNPSSVDTEASTTSTPSPEGSTLGSQDQAPPKKKTPSSQVSEDPLRCLVVDDDPLTRTLFKRMLERIGTVVTTATTGKECVDVVLGTETTQGQDFDLICLDNTMPVMSGEEAVRTIRQAGFRDLYVVGCTGNALMEDQESYRKAGADRILAKPLRLQDVKDIVQTASEKREQRRLKLASKSKKHQNTDIQGSSIKRKEK